MFLRYLARFKIFDCLHYLGNKSPSREIFNLYIQGLSEKAKLPMANRDKTRSKLKVTSLTVIERKTLLLKYRKLRNEATNQIRTDKKEAVRKRIEKSSIENEIWKVISEITKPNNEVNITLNDGGVVISNE